MNSSHDEHFTITLAMTGASGVCYGLRLLECLVEAGADICLLLSPAARTVLATETELQIPEGPEKTQQFFTTLYQASPQQLQVFDPDQWNAPIASGSQTTSAMVVCPCSAGTLSAIAGGGSDNLIERAADVMIKERRRLILVLRETPLSAIHLENMLKLARIGTTILPASPGFYHAPRRVDDLVDFIVARVLDQLAIGHTLLPRWG